MSENTAPGWLRSFIAFFGASAIGLAIDLVGFQLLFALGLPPWLANAISSVTSITAVYILATRHAFGARPGVRTYATFVGWYLLMIALFSFAIEFTSSATGLAPFLCKLMSVPVSFGLNYAFSRLLFARSSGDSQGPAGS